MTPSSAPAAPIAPSAPSTVDASEESRHSSGQRRINLIWETTQAFVALGVVSVTLGVSTYLAVQGRGETSFVLLVSLVNLVIGFYFGRTNHQRVGGVDIGR